MKKQTFPDWLTSQLKERGMSPAELSRSIKKDQSVISRILSGERRPANETLEAIARVLKLPSIQVFEAAGVLPPKTGVDPWLEKMTHRLMILDEPRRALVERLINAIEDETKKT
jgi:transcriptional regulator with XRE-family HTH domain